MKNTFSKIWNLGGFIAAALVVLISTAAAQPTNFASSLPELRAQLDGHLNQPRFSGALWGVKIASLATGKTVYENHADRLMSPASNSKLRMPRSPSTPLVVIINLAHQFWRTEPSDAMVRCKAI